MSDTTVTPADIALGLRQLGKQQQITKVETTDHELASAFADLSISDDLATKRTVTTLITQINDGDTAVLDRIAAGTGTIDDRTALQSLLNSPKLPAGVAKAIESIVTEKVKVDNDGTIADVKRLTKELEAKPDAAKPANSAELVKLIGEQKDVTAKLLKQREATNKLRLTLDFTTHGLFKDLPRKNLPAIQATADEADAFDSALNTELELLNQLDELGKKIAAELSK